MLSLYKRESGVKTELPAKHAKHTKKQLRIITYPMRQPTPIQVVSKNFDGSKVKTWPAYILEQTQSLLVLEAAFPHTVNHPQIGVIEQGAVSIEYYWFDRWHNVFKFLDSAGSLRNYYCNINLPPQFANRTLTYVDLDLDVLIYPDFTFKILDEDEFMENAARFSYPAALVTAARNSLQALIDSVTARGFPFS
jgi:hypothetical protein